ncbi:Isochorismatase-like protein [Leucosporidium creatinivorum]|uniref:Isochorismatase-like protein n=1 Tax=Leucosporidium creatinivorum TaxID=106004 RepID=A0A1Y2G4I3_9BASI|nr:Isochorismatase-like protein [Leucosporidium creatinivorum]
MAVIGKLVQQYRKAGAPVIWVLHDAGAGAPVFDVKAASGDFIGDFRPQGDEVIIVKEAPSSFTRTSLEEDLKKRGIKQIVLTGYMSHVCTTGTARTGFELGYDVVVVKDAIGDRDIPSHDGSSVVKAETVVDVVCHELGDAIGTVVFSKDIK